MWISVLEKEEHERVKSLRASLNGFQSQATPTPYQINALLVSALQGQVTLLRTSRLFPELNESKIVAVSRALRHGPTAVLARELRHCWRVLGVTDSTLRILLRTAVKAVGAATRKARVQFFIDLPPIPRSQQDPKVHVAFEAEGSGQ